LHRVILTHRLCRKVRLRHLDRQLRKDQQFLLVHLCRLLRTDLLLRWVQRPLKGQQYLLVLLILTALLLLKDLLFHLAPPIRRLRLFLMGQRFRRVL
jgi:hypothetical protein